MQIIKYFPLSLIAAALLAGCGTVPNSSFNAAQSSYNSARANPMVTKLAPLELQDAGQTLNKAEVALTKDDQEQVNQLSYIAQQKVAIAEEIAKRKQAEMEIANAGAMSNKVVLQARTAQVDAARQEASRAQAEAQQQALLAQQAARQHAAALAEAQAKNEAAQALIAEQDAQLAKLNAKKTERGMVVTLGDVLFNTNKAKLSAGGINNVQKLAEFLNKYPKRTVLIEGYTDSRGSSGYNQELSERRANAVKSALMGMGVNSNRISTRGMGEASPVAPNDTAAGRQMNRRVEIVFPEQGNSTPNP